MLRPRHCERSEAIQVKKYFMQKNKEIILCMDSSSSPLTLALSAGGKVYCARRAGIKQEDLLFPSLKKLLAEAGCKLKDVKKFFFIKGPGRFTGIRISITLASVLREINGAQIASAGVFDVLMNAAQNSRGFKIWASANPRGAAVVITHAFRDEYFAQIFDGAQKPLWAQKEDLLALLNKQKKPLFIIGQSKEGENLKNIFPSGKFTFAPPKLNKITARAMLDFKPAAQTVSQTLEPLYLKPARFERGK